jgi:hypothetical protein
LEIEIIKRGGASPPPSSESVVWVVVVGLFGEPKDLKKENQKIKTKSVGLRCERNNGSGTVGTFVDDGRRPGVLPASLP